MRSSSFCATGFHLARGCAPSGIAAAAVRVKGKSRLLFPEERCVIRAAHETGPLPAGRDPKTASFFPAGETALQPVACAAAPETAASSCYTKISRLYRQPAQAPRPPYFFAGGGSGRKKATEHVSARACAVIAVPQPAGACATY